MRGQWLVNLSKEERQMLSRKGGLKVSKDSPHMTLIGRKGGLSLSRNREWMRDIGARGLRTQGKRLVSAEPPKQGGESGS